MTAPDKIWAGIYGNAVEKRDIGDVNYIRTDLHRSALADRDATIAELQSKLDLMANDPGAQYFMGIAEGQRIFREMNWPLHLVDSPELAREKVRCWASEDLQLTFSQTVADNWGDQGLSITPGWFTPDTGDVG